MTARASLRLVQGFAHRETITMMVVPPMPWRALTLLLVLPEGMTLPRCERILEEVRDHVLWSALAAQQRRKMRGFSFLRHFRDNLECYGIEVFEPRREVV
jgi:hypothetical protein